MDALDQVAKVTSWDSGGGQTLDLIHLKDGKILAISDELIVLYADEEDLEAGDPSDRPAIRR